MNSKWILKTYLLIAIPVTLIWFGIYFYAQKQKYDFDVTTVINNQLNENKSVEALIASFFDSVKSDLFVVRDANEMNQFILDANMGSIYELKGFFLRIMKNKEQFISLTYYDVHGQGVLGVVSEGGRTKIMDAPNLIGDLDIRDSYKAEGSMHIQEMSSTVRESNGEILDIRFIAPTQYIDGQPTGYVQLVYPIEVMTNIMARVNSENGNYVAKYYLLDGKHVELFDFSEDVSNSYESSWYVDQIKGHLDNHQYGYLLRDGFLITYYDVLGKSREAFNTYSDHWDLISVYEMGDFYAPLSIMKLVTRPASLLVILVLQMIALGIASILNQLRYKNNQLAISRSIADSTDNAVVILDREHRMIDVNEAFVSMMGYTKVSLLNESIEDFRTSRNPDQVYDEIWKSVERHGKFRGVIWTKRKDGLHFLKEFKLIAVASRKSMPISHYVGVFTDLIKESMDIRSNSDTSERMLEQLIDQQMMVHRAPYMVCFYAIDNYSHLKALAQGFDEVNLSELFVEMLQKNLSDSDTVLKIGRNLFIAIIMLDGKSDMSKEDYLEHMHNGLSKLVEFEGDKLNFRVKIGVDVNDHLNKSASDVIKNGMLSLEWALARGAKDVLFFNDDIAQEMMMNSRIETGLISALERNEFNMVYQPQVNGRTGEVLGAESLLRWNNEALGSVSPAVFIPIAEKSNRIIEIGYWIINEVCREVRLAMDQTNIQHDFRWSINISAYQMEDMDFYEKVTHIIDRYKIAYEHLELEITESALVNDPEKKKRLLQRFRSLGITIAIDDFGTGYSSLSYLGNLPIDRIKIDRSFIKDYPHKDNGKLATVLIHLGKVLGYQLIAEGVETDEQKAFLSANGCDMIQGYYYSKPVPMEDFIKKL